MRKIVPIIVFAGTVLSILISTLWSRIDSIPNGPIIFYPTGLWFNETLWGPSTVMQIGVTAAFTLASLFVILSKRYKTEVDIGRTAR
jgi:hypothetical protein